MNLSHMHKIKSLETVKEYSNSIVDYKAAKSHQ